MSPAARATILLTISSVFESFAWYAHPRKVMR
jgi:uncharacterized protein (DUF486 family)